MTRRVIPPSGLPAGRTTVRRASGIKRPAPRRSAAGGTSDTSRTSRAARNGSDNDTSALGGSPYDDPSRDVGDGPDQLTRTQSFVLLVGVLLAVYLLSATCGTAVVSDDPPQHKCHVCAEFRR